jgi:hypothetical protein
MEVPHSCEQEIALKKSQDFVGIQNGEITYFAVLGLLRLQYQK